MKSEMCINDSLHLEASDVQRTYEDSMKRKIDELFEITDMSVNLEAKFNLVIGDLDGLHGKFINHVSDKAYFILEGNGEVYYNNFSRV